ncbi:MAG: SusD/RagB family nutrient-binding outer membrane lipoprotein [Candidatus Cyclobacteriaceae bacterium M3_2C_046]
MKFSKYLIILFSIAFIFSSCEDWIDPEINEDPDNLTDITPNLILPGVEAGLGYYIGGADIAGTLAVWNQQLKGEDRQFQAIDSYILREGDVNNVWGSIYSDVLMDLKQIIEKTGPESGTESAQLRGVAKVLSAVALGNATDLWDNIPWSQALLGNENFQPQYDSQEQIYQVIENYLTEAIADLQISESTRNVYGLENDYIYNGNIENWIKAAYTLRARYQMHLTERGSVDYNSVISDLDNGLTEVADDMMQPYDEGSSGQNPMYQFLIQRAGYINDNDFYTNLLADSTYANMSDPRSGVNVFSGDGYWTSKAAPVAFVQATEGAFIRAEALYRAGDEDAAKQALKDAILLSMERYELSLVNEDNLAWIAAVNEEIDEMSGANLLEMIMTQKYIHMFLQPEAFTDIRRTGYPALEPVQGSELPKRFPYPTDEVEYNPSNAPNVSVFTPVWWDAQ